MAEVEGQVKDEELDPEREARRRIALAQIRQYPDVALKMAARPVEEFDEELRAARRADEAADGSTRAGSGSRRPRSACCSGCSSSTSPRTRSSRVVEPGDRRAERGDDRRRRGLPLDPGRPRPGRAAGDDHDRRPRTRHGAEVRYELEEHLRARRAARDRPSRRRPDPRPDDARGAARGAREPAPAHRPRLSMARRIAVAATAPFGADVLERLAAEHDVVLLLTRPDKPRGRGRKLAAPPAKEAAERLGIPFEQPARLDETVGARRRDRRRLRVRPAHPESLLERALWLNVHPVAAAALARRGAGRARAHGRATRSTGVTIHRTIAALDAGPVAAQRAFADRPRTTTPAPSTRARPRSPPELLDDVLAQAEPSFSRSPRTASRTRRRSGPRTVSSTCPRPGAGARRPRPGALAAHRRAAVVDGRPLIVWRARAAADGSLELVEVQPAGGRRDGVRRVPPWSDADERLAAPRCVRGAAARVRAGGVRRPRLPQRRGRARRARARVRAAARVRRRPAGPDARPRDRDARQAAGAEARSARAGGAAARRVPARLHARPRRTPPRTSRSSSSAAPGSSGRCRSRTR